MRPILFQWGDFFVPSYTFMITFASLAATWVAYKFEERGGLNWIYILDLAIISIIAGFLGARMAHVVMERPDYYLENPIRFFYFWQGGLASYGDYVAIIFACFFYLKWRKLPILNYMDIVALGFPVAIFFGRTGCLLGGCCFGKPTDFFIHLTFHNPGATAYSIHPDISLHATQIYLMAHQVIVWLSLFYVYCKRWRFQGQLFFLMVLLYSVGRFLIEYFRGDDDRGLFFGGYFSSAQLFMIGFFVLGLWGYHYFKKKSYLPPEKVVP